MAAQDGTRAMGQNAPVLARAKTAANRAADRLSEAIAWRVTDRLVGRGVRAVSPAPWHTAADRERWQLDMRTTSVLLAALLPPDGSYLDVGANEGQELEHAVRLAPRGRDAAWEPAAALARTLAERFPGVEVREAALGDQPGPAEFVNVLDRSGQSGLRDRDFPREA